MMASGISRTPRGIERGTLLVSALALVVSLVALGVAIDSVRGDRQSQFDSLRSFCLSEIDEISDTAYAVFWEPYREVIGDQALVERLKDGVGDFNRACVFSGVIPADSALDAPIQRVGAELDVLFQPYLVTFPDESEEQRDERMTRLLAEALYMWGSVLNQADSYVRTLPAVPLLPWVEREQPAVDYNADEAELPQPQTSSDLGQP